jgi:hypothetical protein
MSELKKKSTTKGCQYRAWYDSVVSSNDGFDTRFGPSEEDAEETEEDVDAESRSEEEPRITSPAAAAVFRVAVVGKWEGRRRRSRRRGSREREEGGLGGEGAMVGLGGCRYGLFLEKRKV